MTSKAQHVEQHFESQGTNYLKEFIDEEKSVALEAKGLTPSHYKLFAVRTNDAAGSEIFSPKNVHVGDYSEDFMYGAASGPLPQFRSAIRALHAKARKIETLDQYDIEYSYQVTLFWSDLAKLTKFIGLSAHVSEIIGELLTARYQFLGKDTSKAAMGAIGDALGIAAEAKRFDSSVSEKMADALESGGMDPLVLDSLRNPHA
ncbi:MAG: hypothetical protein V4672_13195 [Verrucomicrobiota bacterium]